MKLDWQFSLYDFFGFLIPGAVMFSALAIIYWGLFIPQEVLQFAPLSVEGWVLILGMSYLCGHLAQSLTNYVPPWNSDLKVSYSGKTSLLNRDSPTIASGADEKARDILAVTLDWAWIRNLDSGSVANICEHYLVQSGKTGDRDIYQHRRGFYRGVSLAYFVLSFALLLRLFISPIIVRLPGVEHIVSNWEMVFLICFFLCAGLLSLKRQLRFQMYLRQLSVYGFLAQAKPRQIHEDVVDSASWHASVQGD